MQALGYRSVSLEFRAARGTTDRLPALAAELVVLGVDVIVTDGGPAAVAAKRATATTPIVIGAAAIDLVRQGLVASLARPGGNVTGFVLSTGSDLNGKRLALLREVMPSLTRAAVVWNPRNEANRHNMASLEVPAKMLGIQLESIPARDVQEMERALRGLDRRRVNATLTLADAFLWSQREQVVALAARYRLPAMYPELDFAEAGGFMAYGPPFAGRLPALPRICGQDSQGRDRPTSRSSARTSSNSYQPQDREGPRPDDPADALTAGGSGHRVTARPAGS